MKLFRNNIHPCFFYESGAALLAFMLVMIMASSYYLVANLNKNILVTSGGYDTRSALYEAKQALIGYAVTYPDHDISGVVDGPGYLPCPDRDKDGDAESNCSDSGPDYTNVGRLPYKTLELEELRDSSGQRLWYAVSENFRYGANKTIPLNSESPSSAQLSVNGVSDVVAVIIAPGEPVGTQSRNPGENAITNEISQYLEDDNNDFDTAYVTSSGGDFNDFIAVITRQELMTAVEKRVLGEVSMMMTEYYNTYGAYPWLTPFADPKSYVRSLSGFHNGGNDETNLTDTSTLMDFNVWGVKHDDIVINITDGSIGEVAVGGITANTLTITGQSLGAENDFDDNDEYVVYLNTYTDVLKGTATVGTSNLTLEDSTNDFVKLGISAGDIVENISDLSNVSSGMVESVTANEIILKALKFSDGTDDVFNSGDTYQIRNNVGRATGGSGGLVLEDTSKDFTVMNIKVGDLIVNNSDGSFGRVSIVNNSTTLTVSELNFGSTNTFSVNNYYSIPRFNTDNNTREGYLAFHEEGKLFPTAFSVDRTITVGAGDVVFDSTSFPGVQAAYSTGLVSYLTAYAATGSDSFPLIEGVCNWSVPEVAECYGSFEDFVNISGRVTNGFGGAGSSSLNFEDDTRNFITDGVKRGDIAHNFDDETLIVSGTAEAGSTGTTLVDTSANFSGYVPYDYVIQNDTLETDLGQSKIQGVISEIIDANTLVVEPYVGEGTTAIEFRDLDNYSIYQPRKMVVTAVTTTTNPNDTVSIRNYQSATVPDFDTGEYYRIMPAANAFSGTVDSTNPSPCTPPSTPCQITDADGDFITNGVEVGDIIENTSDSPSQSFGQITNVTATTITVTLYSGTQNRFDTGDVYTIYHDFVHSRQHQWRPRFSGDQETKPLAEKRIRDVCLGYTINDCSTASTAATFSGNGGKPLITVRDFKLDGTTEVGRATFTPSSSSTGYLRVTDIDYYLAENSGDIAEWFLNNKWHQLMYIAYSEGYTAGGTGSCTAGIDCITLSVAGSPNNDKHAVVIAAGEETDTSRDDSCAAITPVTQYRSSGKMNAYFELENCDQNDDLFQFGTLNSVTDPFNDHVRVID